MIINSPFGIEVATNIWLSQCSIRELTGNWWELMHHDGVLGWKNHRWFSIGIINIEYMWEYE